MSKSFSAVEWMRKKREEIDEEDKNLTWEEKREKTLKLLQNDPIWRRLKARVVNQVSAQRLNKVLEKPK